MKIRHSLRAAIAAVLLSAASQSMATVMTLTATGLPTPTYLAAGAYKGSFDGSGMMPAQFTINSLSFKFNFTDDSTDPFSLSTGTSTSSSSTSSITQGTAMAVTTTTTSTVPVTRFGEKESVQLSFGASTFSGQTNAGTAVNTSTTVSGPLVTGSSAWLKNGLPCVSLVTDLLCKLTTSYTIDQTTTNTLTTDYTGSFTLQDALSASLFADRILKFDLGVSGDLFLSGATLLVDYTAAPVPANKVPEPASLALFGIALAGIARMRRKRAA